MIWTDEDLLGLMFPTGFELKRRVFFLNVRFVHRYSLSQVIDRFEVVSSDFRLQPRSWSRWPEPDELLCT